MPGNQDFSQRREEKPKGARNRFRTCLKSPKNVSTDYRLSWERKSASRFRETFSR
jgi:hypothetical protein